MTKAQHVLLGIFSLLMIATSSLNVVSLPTTAATTTTKTSTTAAPPPYPACDTVPSYSLGSGKAQFINFYQSQNIVQKDQKFNSKNATFYRDYYVAGLKTPWSKWSSADKNAFLSDGTTIYILIDGKPVSLKTEICYDKNGKFYQKKADAVYKMFYLVIPAGTYTGKHDFVMLGFWNGQYDLVRDVKVTFT